MGAAALGGLVRQGDETMQIDTRDPLNSQGSTDHDDATCPVCGAPITGFEATARGPRNTNPDCRHRLARPGNPVRAGGVLHGN